MIEALARLYVNVLEPALQVGLFLVVILFLLGVINFIRDPKAKENFVKTLIGWIFGLMKLILVGAGAVMRGSLDMLYKSIKVIFAAFRDFFSSKI